MTIDDLSYRKIYALLAEAKTGIKNNDIKKAHEALNSCIETLGNVFSDRRLWWEIPMLDTQDTTHAHLKSFATLFWTYAAVAMTEGQRREGQVRIPYDINVEIKDLMTNVSQYEARGEKGIQEFFKKAAEIYSRFDDKIKSPNHR